MIPLYYMLLFKLNLRPSYSTGSDQTDEILIKPVVPLLCVIVCCFPLGSISLKKRAIDTGSNNTQSEMLIHTLVGLCLFSE